MQTHLEIMINHVIVGTGA